MKGKILGINADGGVISAEDGRRYRFELMQWNSDRPPAAGQEADFEIGTEGVAKDVFPLRSGATVDISQVGDKMKGLIGDGAASPLGGRLIALATGNAQFQISLVILLVSLLFTFVRLTGGVITLASEALPDNGTYTVFNIGDLIDFIKAALDQTASSAEALARLTGGSSGSIYLGATPNPTGNPQGVADGMRMMETMTNVFYLAYLAPLGAVAIIIQALRQRATGTLALLTGIASLLAFAGLFAWRWAIVSYLKSAGNTSVSDMASDAIRFGMGAYIILICGLLLTATALGIVKLPEKK